MKVVTGMLVAKGIHKSHISGIVTISAQSIGKKEDHQTEIFQRPKRRPDSPGYGHHYSYNESPVVPDTEFPEDRNG